MRIRVRSWPSAAAPVRTADAMRVPDRGRDGRVCGLRESGDRKCRLMRLHANGKTASHQEAVSSIQSSLASVLMKIDISAVQANTREGDLTRQPDFSSISVSYPGLRSVSCMGRRNESGDDRIERLRPTVICRSPDQVRGASVIQRFKRSGSRKRARCRCLPNAPHKENARRHFRRRQD